MSDKTQQPLITADITDDQIDAVTKAMDTEGRLKWDGTEAITERGHLQHARHEAKRIILAYRACKAIEAAPKAAAMPAVSDKPSVDKLGPGERWMTPDAAKAGLPETHGSGDKLGTGERYFTPKEEKAADKAAAKAAA